jgi:predicted transposase/invertase (TIGR01784 family)
VNPAHLPDFIGDDHTVVDVKATDATGETFQIEMQSWNHAALKERMLYAWADLYEGQLVAGRGYQALRPVVSIWILDQNILRSATHYHHRFQLCDPERGVRLTSNLEIHLLELERWRKRPDNAAPAGELRWMRFFSEAETWVEVPEEIEHPALEHAMSVLQQFKENRNWNDAYRSRLDALRVKITQETTLAAAIAERDAERQEKDRERHEKELALKAQERERKEKEHAQAEAARLRERLRQLGVDPGE